MSNERTREDDLVLFLFGLGIGALGTYASKPAEVEAAQSALKPPLAREGGGECSPGLLLGLITGAAVGISLRKPR